MLRAAFRKMLGIPPIQMDSWVYKYWAEHRPKVAVPYDQDSMGGRFYVPGTRIRFHLDGSMATVLSSFYCNNVREDGSPGLVLTHVVLYDLGDDDGEHDTDLWKASLLHRASRAVWFPAGWQLDWNDRMRQRAYLCWKYSIETTNADNYD